MEELSDNWVGDNGECLVTFFLGRGFFGSLSGLGFHGEGGCNYLCHGHAVGGNGSNGSCLGLMGEDLGVVWFSKASVVHVILAFPVPWTMACPC